MTDDGQLLQRYARERSEAAFGELVTRHIDLVYSVGLRVAGGDTHLAQDVTQTVFLDLARKAQSLPQDAVLAGWLYRHTWFTAAKMVRTERRRRIREQTAMEMRALDDDTGSPWEQIAPHLDEGLNQLSASDRDAIVLRFFKRQDFRVIGAALGVSEDAAQKRVSRALEKLRGVLSKRGATLTATALTAEAVVAAPAGLAVSVTATALAGAATVGTGLSLTTMKVMAMTKLQVGVVGVILIAGIATPLVLQHQSLQQQMSQMAQLAAENQRLSNLLAHAGGAEPLKQQQLGELLRLRGEATRLRASAQADAKAANPMVEMLKSPEGKEMMKANMRAMGQSVARSYAKLFADLHLTPEQTATMKDLMVNKTMAGADMITAAMSGQADPAQVHAQAVQVKADEAAIDEQIKQLLGEANYAQYQAYGQSLSERMVVTQLSDQLADGPKAVRPEQEQQLFDAMVEERQKFTFTTDFSDPSKLKGDVASYYTEDNKQRYLQELEQLSQRYLGRAQSILSPDQLGAFQTSLASQQAMQGASVTVGAKLFPPKSAAN